MKAKLLGLDYVLAHSDRAFFATYYERMAFFTEVPAIEREALRVKFYGPEAERRPRYFVDGFPLGLSTGTGGEPFLTFCYVYEGGHRSVRFRPI